MKYVLVVDVPEPMESDDVRIDYYVYYHCADSIKSKNGCKMKPLPKPSALQVMSGEYAKGFFDGWDKCLEGILKDEE